MPFTVREISERFSQNVELASGNDAILVAGIASPSSAKPNQMIFVSDKSHLVQAMASQSQVWVVKSTLFNLLNSIPKEVALLKSKDAQLAMALIGREFFRSQLNGFDFDEQWVHPSAIVHPTAQIASDVKIGPNSTVGAKVQISEGARIGANTTIEAGAKIGRRTQIHSQVYIGPSVEIGAECEVHPQTSIGTEGFGYAWDEKGQHHRQTHFGTVVIEDRVHIGAGVQIDRGTLDDSRIGAGTIIDNHCHFGHNIKIGKGTIITGGMITAGSVTIGDRCVFGGRTTISGHLSIASGSQIAGLSGVSSSVEKAGQYGGYPLQPLKKALKSTASLAQLPRLRKNVSRLMKHLGFKEEDQENE